MMAPVAQLEAAFGRHGIPADSRVVLYSIGTAMWATRFWWMLRSLGFDNVAVLDGGIDKWTAEGRDIETGLTEATTRTRVFRRSRGPAFSSARTMCSPRKGDQHGHRQRAGPAILQGVGAEPLWTARAHPRELQRSGSDTDRSRNQGVRAAGGGRDEIRRAGFSQRQAGDRLLRRRHLGHHRPLHAAPARLRQADAL